MFVINGSEVKIVRRLTPWAGLLAAVSISLGVPHLADADTLRYTVIAENVTGIVLGTLLPNCANNPCVITMTGVGDTAAVTGFQALAGTSTVIGAGAINGALTNITVTVYDPLSGLTYGPGTLPSGYFIGYDSINGGVGFGSNAPAGPAYPLSVFF